LLNKAPAMKVVLARPGEEKFSLPGLALAYAISSLRSLAGTSGLTMSDSGAEATRDIPLLFLLDQKALDREEAFLSTGIRTLSARGNLVPGGLTNQLVSALDPYRPA